LNKDDGIFFMKVEDFKTYFEYMSITPDTSNWKHSYWMKLGNANTIGTAGTNK
jgi:hypothetical protein